MVLAHQLVLFNGLMWAVHSIVTAGRYYGVCRGATSESERSGQASQRSDRYAERKSIKQSIGAKKALMAPSLEVVRREATRECQIHAAGSGAGSGSGSGSGCGGVASSGTESVLARLAGQGAQDATDDKEAVAKTATVEIVRHEGERVEARGRGRRRRVGLT